MVSESLQKTPLLNDIRVFLLLGRPGHTPREGEAPGIYADADFLLAQTRELECGHDKVLLGVPL